MISQNRSHQISGLSSEHIVCVQMYCFDKSNGSSIWDFIENFSFFKFFFFFAVLLSVCATFNILSDAFFSQLVP